MGDIGFLQIIESISYNLGAGLIIMKSTSCNRVLDVY